MEAADPLPPAIEIEGASRYLTAVAASLETYPEGLDPAGAKAVVIATGLNWPDALGGSALAGALDGPILLVRTSVVPGSVLDELDRLGAEKAYVVGGAGAVDDDAVAMLEGAGLVVERVWGQDRYLTADAIALKTIQILDATGDGFSGTAFVTTGGSYADAVAAAPLAASQGWPLFLARSTGGLRLATIAAMADVTDVLVLGGEGAVNAATYETIEGMVGEEHVERLWGATRYATAVAIATYAVANTELEWNRVGIATGESYPDALAGGVLQGKMGSVMLLTRTATLRSETRTALEANKDVISTVTFFGGTAAVSQAVRDEVMQIIE